MSRRFKTVSYEEYFEVIYDVETLVMYAVSKGCCNQGNLTPLIDSDGTPLLYEGGINE